MSKRGGRQSDGTRALRMLRQSEKANKGFKMTPPDLPSTFVSAPWNSWTFERTYLSTSDNQVFPLTIELLITQIATDLSLSSIERVRIKIQSGQIWVTTGPTLVQPSFEAKFFELSQSDAQIRSLQRDVGNWNKPAKAGYVYPTVDKQEIYGINDAARDVLTATVSNLGSTVTLRVQLLWKSLTPI